MKGALWCILAAGCASAASSVRQPSAASSLRTTGRHSAKSSSSASATVASTAVAAGITDIPVYNATLPGTPADTTVDVVPSASECNYTTGELYCFPISNAFVQMTGWTKFFYNKNYGLINNSGLVDVTMYFATDDSPAANWLGVKNTGEVPINVNISWFTSTLSPQATYSAADPYYFYVRPNSAVYNAYPTGSSRGPTFYAVQTPVAKLAVAVTATSASSGSSTSSTGSAASTSANGAGSSSGTSTTSNNSSLSRGAIAGIAIGAIALFFVLILLGIVLFLLLRRQRHSRDAAIAAAEAHDEKQRRNELAPGNLYTPAELAAAQGLQSPGTRRPSVGQTDSSGSVPAIIYTMPMERNMSPVRRASLARAARPRVEHYSPPNSRTSPINNGQIGTAL